MATVRVTPAAGGWQVRVGRGIVSNHRKKDRALQAARRRANPGDRLEVRGRDGTIQRRVTVRT